MATAKKTKAEAAPTVEFVEHDDVVTAKFPSMNGAGPFEVTLMNMHWGLVEDISKMQAEPENEAILNFFREYVEGGPRAVPFRHTLTVFEAITAYIEQVTEETKN